MPQTLVRAKEDIQNSNAEVFEARSKIFGWHLAIRPKDVDGPTRVIRLKQLLPEKAIKMLPKQDSFSVCKFTKQEFSDPDHPGTYTPLRSDAAFLQITDKRVRTYLDKIGSQEFLRLVMEDGRVWEIGI